jgi:pimeloyl-ACP methyl ester carboxylesterase
VLIAAVALAAALPYNSQASPSVQVGTQRLSRCHPRESAMGFPGYCGVLRVPLDWNDRAAGTIGIRFQWIPAAKPGVARTIVAQEGGPGFASTGSALMYLLLFWNLMFDRNLLLMDERGTGASTPIDCKPLQRAMTVTSSTDWQRAAEACGVQLNHTFLRTDGTGYAHASDLFATAQSVRDLLAIVGALGLKPVDLFGDSYGSFFAQAFAVNHPELVRSVVLDSTYPLDQDQFDEPAWQEVRFAYDAVCARSLACRGAAPGSSTARIRRLARRLAGAPLVTATRAYGADDLASLLIAASLDTPLLEYHDLDAAARGWLERSDAVPLARLFERSKIAAALPSSFTEFSAGMELAGECTEYVNPFDMEAPFDERALQYHAAVAALAPSFFDPVPNADALAARNESFDECLRWPPPVHHDPLVTTPPPLLPPTVPVLIVSGDLDSTTPPGDAQRARERLGPSVRFVAIPNTGHDPSLFDGNDCAQRIVRAFIAAPDARLDTSCTARVPEVRAVGVFPATLAEQPPASPRAGDRARPAEARLAAIAVGAVGDAIESARFLSGTGNGRLDRLYGKGLRGGGFVATDGVRSIELRRYAYSRDTTVSGTISIAQGPLSFGAGVVTSHVHARYEGGPIAEDLILRWDERVPHARASIDGRAASGRAIHASVPAP